jgi:predicted aspartyl protease
LALQRKQFQAFRIENKENMAKFCDRFSRFMRLASRIDDVNTRYHFLDRLPTDIQDRIDMAKLTPENNTLDQLQTEVIKIEETNRYRYPRRQHTPSLPPQQLPQHPSAPNGPCTYCASKGFPDRPHSVEYCRTKKFDDKHKKKPDEKPRDGTVKAISAPNHPEFPALGEKILIPVHINDKPYYLPVDTGANTSCLSPQIIHDLKLKIIGNGHIKQFAASTDRVQAEICEKVCIKAGKYSVTAPFYVLESANGVSGILGTNILPQLGISITNLPVDLPDISPCPTPALPSEPAPPTDFSAIQDALGRNAALPKTTHCTHPASIVKLDINDGTPIYQRQYPIPHHLHSVVQETIHTWLEHDYY